MSKKMLLIAAVVSLSLISINANTFAIEAPECPTCEDGVDGKDGTDGNDGVDGKNGRNGRDGKDGVTTVVTKLACPGCLEDRIQMGDAVSAAIPSPVLRYDKDFGIFIGGGFAESQTAVGVAGIARIKESFTISLGLGTNLREVCDDRETCVQHYDVFDYWSGNIQAGFEF